MLTPGMLDILAMQRIYGADTTTRKGNNTYTFDSAEAAIRTIWDAGGIDTFDLSAQTRPSYVNLTAVTSRASITIRARRRSRPGSRRSATTTATT